eukprot:scaffold15140_cov90-Isochrysis_galbana.AAC.1
MAGGVGVGAAKGAAEGAAGTAEGRAAASVLHWEGGGLQVLCCIFHPGRPNDDGHDDRTTQGRDRWPARSPASSCGCPTMSSSVSLDGWGCATSGASQPPAGCCSTARVRRRRQTQSRMLSGSGPG